MRDPPLELLPYAIMSSVRPVGILTFDKKFTEVVLADHPEFSRLRIVGVGDLPSWSVMWQPRLVCEKSADY